MPRESSDAVVNAIIAWFTRQGRDLPWRGGRTDAWGVLVSEVMLQQTPVARVEPVWIDWMARWPTPAALAAATQADAVRAWGRLGYPRRAARLWECAVAITDRHGGVVPRDEASLLALPGVGAYTAAAIMAFAHHQRAIVLDTNVRRVIARIWDGQEFPPAHISKAERLRANSLAPVKDADAATWAVASMELGALVCTARAPRCDACPVADRCGWRAAGYPASATVRRTQAWAGTDRQVRGRILAVLRAAHAPVTIAGRAELADVEPGQMDRCLESLVADGLVQVADASRGQYEL